MTRRDILITLGLFCTLLGLVSALYDLAWQNGRRHGEQSMRDEAKIYVAACHDMKQMGFDDFNRHLAAIKTGAPLSETDMLPAYDCRYVEDLSNFYPEIGK